MKYGEHILDKNPKVFLTTYLLDNVREGQKRPLVIVCPGGAYLQCCSYEGESVAMHFMRAGYHAAVLEYSTQQSAQGNSAFPQPLYDMARAIMLVRENAKDWGVNSEQIVIVGFSAGAHLCASYGNLWNSAILENYGEPLQRKPNAVILGYPLADLRLNKKEMQKKMAENIDLQSVVGGDAFFMRYKSLFDRSEIAMYGHSNPTEEEMEWADPIRHISKDTPPTFLWHTFEDEMLSPLHSVNYAAKLCDAGIPCEMHLFDKGVHGLAMADETSAKKEQQIDSHVAHWSELASEWLKRVFENI